MKSQKIIIYTNGLFVVLSYFTQVTYYYSYCYNDKTEMYASWSYGVYKILHFQKKLIKY